MRPEVTIENIIKTKLTHKYPPKFLFASTVNLGGEISNKFFVTITKKALRFKVR
jgi:hypothetical protein